MSGKVPDYISTTNACKLCRPLGACLAFKGMEGTVPFLHGSQGCATYMRRYIISHYNEPMDIASSSLSEKHAVYGGGPNLKLGLTNVRNKYAPDMIGIATTCLTETIGDDVSLYLKEYMNELGAQAGLPKFVNVASPSYSGTHMEGFHGAVKAVVEQMAQGGPVTECINLLPGFVSCADYRLLSEIMEDFGTPCTMLPDLSLTMDRPALLEYEKVPQGGTPLEKIRKMGRSRATIEFGRTLEKSDTAGTVLNERFKIRRYLVGMPLGIEETDRFFNLLSRITGRPVPEKYALERGRLIDSYVDGHKYVFGKKAVIYGEEDLVTGLSAFLAEIGVRPVLCASGGRSGLLAGAIRDVTADILPEQPAVYEGMDFFDISEMAESLKPDIIIGHSKGYPLARKLGIPLVRVGFPIHDRIGGHRILHLGYRGAQALFDTVVNAIIARKQNRSDVGYAYM